MYADGSTTVEVGRSLLSTSVASSGAALALWKKPTVAAARRSVGNMAGDSGDTDVSLTFLLHLND